MRGFVIKCDVWTLAGAVALALPVGTDSAFGIAERPRRAPHQASIDGVFETPSADLVAEITHPGFRNELLRMAYEDQLARSAGGCAPSTCGPDGAVGATAQSVGETDRRNTRLLKQLIAEHGWPTFSMVGSDGARSAWLLVQHADHDVEWQERSLRLMKSNEETGQVSRADIAYLTDRVLVNQGRPQVYGTQFHSVEGIRQPRPIANPDFVDPRRETMGLTPLEEYAAFMDT